MKERLTASSVSFWRALGSWKEGGLGLLGSILAWLYCVMSGTTISCGASSIVLFVWAFHPVTKKWKYRWLFTAMCVLAALSLAVLCLRNTFSEDAKQLLFLISIILLTSSGLLSWKSRKRKYSDRVYDTHWIIRVTLLNRRHGSISSVSVADVPARAYFQFLKRYRDFMRTRCGIHLSGDEVVCLLDTFPVVLLCNADAERATELARDLEALGASVRIDAAD